MRFTSASWSGRPTSGMSWHITENGPSVDNVKLGNHVIPPLPATLRSLRYCSSGQTVLFRAQQRTALGMHHGTARQGSSGSARR
jgi:hypothetical protein